MRIRRSSEINRTWRRAVAGNATGEDRMENDSQMDHTVECRAFWILLHKCLHIQPEDELLVIYDESLRLFIDALLHVIEKESVSATFIYMPECLQNLLVQE